MAFPLLILDKVKKFLYMDKYVAKYRQEEILLTQRLICLIACIGFLVMSILNIRQHSFLMLVTTGGASLFLFIGYLVCRRTNSTTVLRAAFFLVLLIIFPIYALRGGNDGFAALWLTLLTYVVMHSIDFRAGFLISLFYMLMLILCFIGPLDFMVTYDYNETFLLRYPFLYTINFAFATYIIASIRIYQYRLLINQQQLLDLSTKDLNTGLLNRNAFIQYEQRAAGNILRNLSVVFMDANGLHELNNSKGHAAGDLMLRTVANTSKEVFAGHDVYRMGGDEFLIIGDGLSEKEASEKAAEVAKRVDEAGYSVSYGVAWSESVFDLNALVKLSNKRMADFKAEYYRSTVKDGRTTSREDAEG